MKWAVYHTWDNSVLKGIITIRALGKQEYMLGQYVKQLADSIHTFMMQLTLEQWMYIRLYLLSNSFQFIIAIASTLIILLDYQIDYNLIVLSYTYTILFSQSICEVVNYSCQIESELVSVERLRSFFDNEVEKPDQLQLQSPEEYSRYKHIELTLSELQQNLSISFKDIWISYENSNEYALKNFTLNIQRGEKIAICGRTGSGKTSILNCLYRLYKYQRGKIFINNKDTMNMSIHEVRGKMAIIPQFGFLFNSTLRQNIDPLEEKTEQEILDLLSSLSQNREKSVNKDFEYGDINFEIEEGGKNLSNGQKQMINFMRIALRDNDIICLDEATSNMDPVMDKLIHNALFSLSNNKTLIVITHRLENIHKFDRIIVLDFGEIVESGSFENLKSIKNGYFNQLIS